MGGARAKPASGWKGLCTRILRFASSARVLGIVTAVPQPMQTSAVTHVCSNVANPPKAWSTLLFLVQRFRSHTTLELSHSELSVLRRLDGGNVQFHDVKIKHRLLLQVHLRKARAADLNCTCIRQIG